MVSMIAMFNPGRIIFGGGVMEGLPEFIQLIDQGARQRALVAALEPLEIVAAELGGQAGTIGAAVMMLEQNAGQASGL